MAAEMAISSAVQLLGDLLIKKVNFLRGVKEQVMSLKDELKRMQSFLTDANKKQTEDERVRNWISEIREVAYDSQDVIEMFLLKVESRGLLGRFSSFPNNVYYVNKVGAEIESIQKRLEAIDKSRERYGIKDLGEGADSASRSQVELRRRLAPWKKDEHLVGMEDDVKKLLQGSILNEEKKGLTVAVVEGMGGIGKSTLARTIYNHPDVVGDRFEYRGWVVVSSEFTPQETIKQLILELPSCEEDQKKLRELEESTKDKLYLQQKLREMLHKQLQGKTYFIVLDDVWEKDHLESLISAFPDEQDQTSRLLITSRNKVIAKYSQYALEMKVLDPEKSWDLFLKKTFIDKSDVECPQELESIGRKIVGKCDGLPLAISIVAGLLIEKQTKNGWEKVLNEINFHLGRAESSISSILELSYLNLSPQLKSCFLCLAFFKEDSIIPAKRIIHLWVAQGLIQQEGGRTEEDIARGYLDELINRNMVQLDDFSMDNRVKYCHLHDLLREVCIRKAKDEIGFEMLKGEEGVSSESSYKPRHRVVYGKNIRTFSSNHNEHLRSLFILNVNEDDDVYVSSPSGYWKSFQHLKILDLEGIKLQTFPRSFRSLLGLKYLRICRHNYRIFPGSIVLVGGALAETLKLPRWLDHLKELEVLDMEGQYVEFPSIAMKMDRLRHFHAYCVRGLMKIENWTNIETLKYISVDNLMRCNSRLIASCPVRELGIVLDAGKGPDELSNVRVLLEKMENLVKLHLIHHPYSPSGTLNISNLGNLTELKLRGTMTQCLAASMLPPNLSRLTLEHAYLDQDPMAELGKLPKLLYLKLLESAYLGERMQVLHDGFPCLISLSLRFMRQLRVMDIQEGGMLHLKQLQIHGCPALETKNLPEHIISSA